MGIINKARLDAVARNYRALFFMALDRGKEELANIANRFFLEVLSTGAAENYNWIGDVPAMEEWLGDRPHSDLRAQGFELANKEWATGIKLAADDIEDDRLGTLAPRINSLVTAYATHVYAKLVELIELGHTGLCYDGQGFFDTDHSEGTSGTQINYATGGGSALASGTFRTYRTRMLELKNDKGNLLGIRPTHMWVPSGLEGTAREILEAERNATGATNIDARLGVEVLVLPGLTSATRWGLVDLSKALKPFVKQIRRSVNVTSLTDPESPEFYHRRECLFGVDYRGNYGYGMWQTMAMADGA